MNLWYNVLTNIQMGENCMKLLCKCGNVEDIKTDKTIERYEFKSCDDGTVILVCKNCSEAVFINLKNG